MKTIAVYLSSVALIMMMGNAAFAQSGNTTQSSGQSPTAITDKNVTGPMETDLNSRSIQIGSNPVTWWDNGNGYYGTYSVGDGSYMSRYGKDGTFQGTYQKKDWSDPSLSASLKNSFDNSPYKSQQVTSYWESTDPTQKAYYLELTDSKNKTSKVWVDDKGKFSSRPPKDQIAK